MLRIALLALLLPLIPAAAHADGRTMIVLDASGSMWGQIGGRTKVEIAREVLATVLGTVPAETELGLVVYGHRTRGDCSDIEVAVEAAPGTAQAIIDFANQTRFQGKTPLTQSVRVAAEALRSSEEKATVILVTDGIETCEADPCALGAELEASGVDFTAHVVGFGLNEEEGRAVACLAEATGGQYLPAADAAELGEALTRTVAAAPEPEPEPVPEPEPAALDYNLAATASLAEGGENLTEDLYWEIVPAAGGDTLNYTYGPEYTYAAPAGDYVLRLKIGQVAKELPVTLVADDLTLVHFVLNAAAVKLTGVREEGGAEDGSIYVEVAQGDVMAYGYGNLSSVMPAGDLVLTGRQGKAEVSRTVTLLPGDRVEEVVVVGSGIAAVSALYAPGGPPVDGNGIYFEVLGAAQKIDGSRDSFAYTYGTGQLDVPAGDYVLYAKVGEAEMTSEPFTVAAGGRTDVQLVMNAGVAAISAPGSARLNVFSEAKDINGNRREVGYSYDEEYQKAYPAGRYVVVAGYDGDRADQEVAFEVKAGERVEVAVP